MTLQLILHYSALYLLIGFISAYIINYFVEASGDEPYTGKEIPLMIILWPLNVLVFIAGIIFSIFR